MSSETKTPRAATNSRGETTATEKQSCADDTATTTSEQYPKPLEIINDLDMVIDSVNMARESLQGHIDDSKSPDAQMLSGLVRILAPAAETALELKQRMRAPQPLTLSPLRKDIVHSAGCELEMLSLGTLGMAYLPGGEAGCNADLAVLRAVMDRVKTLAGVVMSGVDDDDTDIGLSDRYHGDRLPWFTTQALITEEQNRLYAAEGGAA